MKRPHRQRWNQAPAALLLAMACSAACAGSDDPTTFSSLSPGEPMPAPTMAPMPATSPAPGRGAAAPVAPRNPAPDMPRTPAPEMTMVQPSTPRPEPAQEPTTPKPELEPMMAPTTSTAGSTCQVGPVPDDIRERFSLSDFYQKYADAGGIPIVTSEQPVDKTLTLACLLVDELVGERPDVRAALIENQSHFTIIGVNELTNDTPEFSDQPDSINQRARGLGGRIASCAEENILCDRQLDRWRGESICVHEFSHTIAVYGLYAADPTFRQRLTTTWQTAMDEGLFANTYATENAQEYWAEGVQDWYDTNLEAIPSNGVHNEVNLKSELKTYDARLYAMIDELLPETPRWADCYRATPRPE